MEIQENTFAEACFNQNSVQELVEALHYGADEDDMKQWSLNESEWKAQVIAAIFAKSEENGEYTYDGEKIAVTQLPYVSDCGEQYKAQAVTQTGEIGTIYWNVFDEVPEYAGDDDMCDWESPVCFEVR